MGKHHRKWFIEEPIASNKKTDDLMDDLENYYNETKDKE